MAPDIKDAAHDVLESFELWVIALAVAVTAGEQSGKRRESARRLLIDTVEDLLEAIKFEEDHGGLGRGGQP